MEVSPVLVMLTIDSEPFACRWIADANISAHMFRASDVSSMLDYLGFIKPQEVSTLQQNGIAVRHWFMYQPHTEANNKTVPDLIIQSMCAQP